MVIVCCVVLRPDYSDPKLTLISDCMKWFSCFFSFSIPLITSLIPTDNERFRGIRPVAVCVINVTLVKKVQGIRMPHTFTLCGRLLNGFLCLFCKLRLPRMCLY